MTEPKLSLQAWARAREKAPEMLALLREAPLPNVAGTGNLYANSDAIVAWTVKTDALVAYILGEPTREEEEQHDDEGVELSCEGFGPAGDRITDEHGNTYIGKEVNDE